jgi:hypothetical protein
MTHDQVAGLLSGLVGISVLVVGYTRFFAVTYGGLPKLKPWVKWVFGVLIAVQVVALVALFV